MAKYVEPDNRLLSEQELMRILDRLEQVSNKQGIFYLSVMSYWSGELRWARNRVSLASDRRDIFVWIGRNIRDGRGSTATNQIDDASLEGAMKAAERMAIERASNHPQDQALEFVNLGYPTATTWSDATFGRTARENGQLVQRLTEKAEARELLSAGYLEVQGGTVRLRLIDEYGRVNNLVGRQTQAQCSMTVRHPKGTGSGWAGLSNYDIERIDEVALADLAFEKCVSSLDPVRIEPGRYTVILEPQAVSDLVNLIVNGALSRSDAELGKGPFVVGLDKSVNRWRSKLGLKIVDERVTISHDPSDPQLGIIPGFDMEPVTWIENGILKALSQDRMRALNEMNVNNGVQHRASFRMSGGTTTIEEMIAGTERGLLVTRFSNPEIIDNSSLLSTGLTRDGLWLIEKGKISKAVRNFRFTESPLFVLNNIEQLGVPVPVFNPNNTPQVLAFAPQYGLRSVIVPPLKVRDFSFTSTIDAV